MLGMIQDTTELPAHIKIIQILNQTLVEEYHLQLGLEEWISTKKWACILKFFFFSSFFFQDYLYTIYFFYSL